MKRFQIGDRVFDIRYGWGTVTIFDGDDDIAIKFDNSTNDHYFSGKGLGTISFTEYTLDGYTSDRPELTWWSVNKEWIDSKKTQYFVDFLDENFEPPVRKCK